MARPHNKIEKSEFDQRVLDVARVTRVVAGGRRFSFRATVAVGNKKGSVGIGLGKGLDVSQSVEGSTIPHEIEAKYASAKVFLKPAPTGTGLVAGGALRAICELAGIENISAKILSKSTNKINNARAAVEALKKIKALKK